MAIQDNQDGLTDDEGAKKKLASSDGAKGYEESIHTVGSFASSKSSLRQIKSTPPTREERLAMKAALDKARVEHLNFLNDPSYFRKGDRLHMIDKLADELKQYLNAADVTRVLTNLLEFLYDPSTRPEDPVDYFAKLTKEKKIDKRELNKARRELFRLLKKEYALKDEIAKLRKMLSLLNPIEFDEDGVERSPSQVAARLEQIRIEQERKQKEKLDEEMKLKEQEIAEASVPAEPATVKSDPKLTVDSEGEEKSKSSGSRKSKRKNAPGDKKKKNADKKGKSKKPRAEKKTKKK